MSRPRVLFLADRSRPDVMDQLEEIRRGVARHAEITGEFSTDGERIPDSIEAQLAVVLGGDGTLLASD